MESKKSIAIRLGTFIKKSLMDFWNDETGSGVVELILIIVVLIGLVIIFKTQLTEIVNSIFDTIRSKASSV